MRTLIFTFIASFLFSTCGVMPLFAQSNTFAHIDRTTIQKGYTFTFEGDFKVSIPPLALPGETDLVLGRSYPQGQAQNMIRTPKGVVFVSNIFFYDFSDVPSLQKDIHLSITVPGVGDSSALYWYDEHAGRWERLETTISHSGVLSAATNHPRGSVAVLEYQTDQIVLASLLNDSHAVLVEDNDQQIFVAKNTNEVFPLASLTKLMTALVFLEHNPGWNKKVSITKEDDSEPAKIAFKIGDVVMVKDLFSSMLIGSKNNSAKALARSTGMSEAEFVKKMNQKAQNLGMRKTQFVDVTGLRKDNHSTVREYYAVLRAAMKQETIRSAVQQKTYTVRVLNRNAHFFVTTTNDLLKSYKGVYGKTGFIPESGYNLVLVKEQTANPKFILIFGAPTTVERFDLARLLLQYDW